MGNTAATPESGKSSASVTADNKNEGLIQKLRWPLCKPKKLSCVRDILKIVYVVLSAVTICASLAVIGVTVAAALVLQLSDLSSDPSGRVVAMVVLASTSALVLSLTIYALGAVLTKKKISKPVHTVCVATVVLAIIQMTVVGVSVPVTLGDEVDVTRALSDSFRKARDDPKVAKTWANIQSQLTCCGLNGPNDYSVLSLQRFIPNVPISCCPSYDAERPEIVQERNKEICKMSRSYYSVGCVAPVITEIRRTSHVLLCVSVAYIVLILIQAVVGAVLVKKAKQSMSMEEERTEVVEPPVVPQKTKAKLSLT